MTTARSLASPQQGGDVVGGGMVLALAEPLQRGFCTRFGCGTSASLESWRSRGALDYMRGPVRDVA